MKPCGSLVAVCLFLAAAVGASCAPHAVGAPPASASTATSEAGGTGVLMSTPAEYVERPVSAEAGSDYFLRIGVGDPYGAGIAYPVLLALMEAYPDVLGRDWNELADRFGFIRDPEAKGDPRAPAIGFHLTLDPKTRVPWVVNNCQMCHADRLRLPSGDVVVEGLGSKRVRPHAYVNALLRVGGNPELDERLIEKLAAKRAREWGVPWDPSMRRPIVKATLEGLRLLASRTEAASARFDAGLPGRAATIESFAIALNAFAGSHIPLPASPGWAKVPDVVGSPYRTTFSWDASGSGTPEGLVLDASFVFGTRPAWYVAHPNIASSMYQYLHTFRRQLHYPGSIDAALAARGHARFDETCAGCHGTYGNRGGEVREARVSYREAVVPESFVGTDPAREEAVTPAFVEAANDLPLTKGLTTVRHTGGYVPPVLLDVWARGLFGHAGQWPSLEVLATAPDARPRQFIVDTDGAYDLDRVGVRYEVPKAPRSLRPGEYLYDAAAPGLGVGGHPFLAELGADDRRAVIEYLKTL
jgi:mono/diheme cytochrome c family protein